MSMARWFSSLTSLAANNVRHDREDDLVLGVILRGLAEEILEDRNLRQPRNASSEIWSAGLP